MKPFRLHYILAFISCFFLIGTLNTQAQNSYFYDFDDGLPNNWQVLINPYGKYVPPDQIIQQHIVEEQLLPLTSTYNYLIGVKANDLDFTNNTNVILSFYTQIDNPNSLPIYIKIWNDDAVVDSILIDVTTYDGYMEFDISDVAVGEGDVDIEFRKPSLGNVDMEVDNVQAMTTDPLDITLIEEPPRGNYRFAVPGCIDSLDSNITFYIENTFDTPIYNVVINNIVLQNQNGQEVAMDSILYRVGNIRLVSLFPEAPSRISIAEIEGKGTGYFHYKLNPDLADINLGMGIVQINVQYSLDPLGLNKSSQPAAKHLSLGCCNEQSIDYGITSAIQHYIGAQGHVHITGASFNSSEGYDISASSYILLRPDTTNTDTTRAVHIKPYSAVILSIKEECFEEVIAKTDASSSENENKETYLTKEMLIYPNPCEEYLNIEIPILEEDMIEIYLIDLYGRKVVIIESSKQLEGIYKGVVDVSSLNSGIYFIHYKTSSFNKVVEFIKH